MAYRFGAFELDASTRELRKDGVRVETEPKAFDLLLYLLRHRERVVSKDELLTEIWPKQIVTETALTRCVMKARRSVDDDSESQSVIRTIHGRGYRFVAQANEGTATPVAEKSGGAAPPPSASTPAPTRDPGRSGVIAAGIAVLLTVAIAVAWVVGREAPSAPAGTVAVLPVHNQVAQADLEWVSAGLMSLLARMLEESGIEVAEERDVLASVAEVSLEAPPDPEIVEKIHRGAGAQTVLHTILDQQGGLYRLSATLNHPDGRRTRRLIVGESPASVAADLAGVISGLLSSERVYRPERFSKVSTDPFVNELYARALDLELAGEMEEARELFRVAAKQEPELFWLRYEIALCTRDLREWDEAEAMFKALRDEAEAGDDLRARIVSLNSHGILKLNRNDYEAARSLFEQALALAEAQGGPGDRISPLVNLALVSTRLGNPTEAREFYIGAEQASRAAGKKPGPFFHNNFAGLLMQMGDLDQARIHSEAAIEEFRLHGQRRFEAPALNRLAKILRRQGDREGAIERHEQALAIYRDLGNDLGELSVQLAMTEVYRANGDLTRARANVDAVLERAEGLDSRLLQGDALIASGQVASDMQDQQAAMAAYEAALALFETIGEDQGLTAARRGITLTSIETGALERARDMAQQMLESSRESGYPAAGARAQLLMGRVHRAEGDPDAARQQISEALAYARSKADTEILAEAATVLAGIELEEGNTDEAAALIDEARPHSADEFDFVRLEAQLARAQGNTERARTLLAHLRTASGEAWTPQDEALLASLAE